MNRDDVAWRGYWVAAPTAFGPGGELDEPAFRQALRLYLNQGVHGLLVNGTTGEWFAQNPAERRRDARTAGAAGAAFTPPPYMHPSDTEVVAFFRAVTDAVDLPWMVYNWPRGALGAGFAVPYFEALWRGDLDTARRLGAQYAHLSAQLVKPDYSGRFASPTAQLKAAMNLLGQPGTHVRPPLLDLTDPEALRDLAQALRVGGLDTAEACP